MPKGSQNDQLAIAIERLQGATLEEILRAFQSLYRAIGSLDAAEVCEYLHLVGMMARLRADSQTRSVLTQFGEALRLRAKTILRTRDASGSRTASPEQFDDAFRQFYPLAGKGLPSGLTRDWENTPFSLSGFR